MTRPDLRCDPTTDLGRLTRLLDTGEPLSTGERHELLCLATACYESWCLRPAHRHRCELRIAGLVLLARACLRAEHHRQGLIHARRAWKLLRAHPHHPEVLDSVIALLIRLSERCTPAQAEHWRHIGCALGLAAAA